MSKETEASRVVIPQVSPASIDDQIAGGTLVIDVREPDAYGQSHVPGAINVSIGLLPEKAATVIPDKDSPVVCYCNGGSRGPRAAAELQKLGYSKVSSLAGGLKAYLAKG